MASARPGCLRTYRHHPHDGGSRCLQDSTPSHYRKRRRWGSAERKAISLCSSSLEVSRPEKNESLAVATIQNINWLPADARGHRTLRLVTAAGPESQPPEDLEYLSSGCVIRVADDIDPLLALGHCDALLAVQAVEQTESIALVAAALARGIPVIAPDAGAAPGMITDGSRVAGTLVPLDLRSRIGTDALTAALLRYLTEPTVHEAHCARASAIFQSRFHIEVVAAACLEAYSGALDPLRAQRVREHAEAARARTQARPSRQSA